MERRSCWHTVESSKLVIRKSLGAWLYPRGVDFHPQEVAIYLLFHSFNATEGRDGLSFSYLLTTFSKVVWFAPYKRTQISILFKINNNNSVASHLAIASQLLAIKEAHLPFYSAWAQKYHTVSGAAVYLLGTDEDDFENLENVSTVEIEADEDVSTSIAD